MRLDYTKLKSKIVEKYGTQANFATAINRTESYVSMILHNKTYLTVAEVLYWSAVLGIGRDDIPIYFLTKVE